MRFQNAITLASEPSSIIVDIVICVGVTAKLMTDIVWSAWWVQIIKLEQ